MRTLANLGSRVSARGALLRLVVERTATTPAAEAVGLVVPFTETRGSLRCLGCQHRRLEGKSIGGERLVMRWGNRAR